VDLNEEKEPPYEDERPYGDSFQPSPAPAFSSSSSLNPHFAMWALNNERELESFVKSLRGLKPVWDNNIKQVTWVPGAADPLVNEEGAENIHRFLRGFTSKLITLSALPERQVTADLKVNAFDFAQYLFINYKRFGLAPEHYDFVVLEGVNFIEFALYKACKGRTMDFVNPSVTGVRQEVVQRLEREKNRGFFDNFGLQSGKR